jgi:hypothetical protein
LKDVTVLGVEEDPDGVVGGVKFEKDSAREGEWEKVSEGEMGEGREGTNSIVFSTSSNPLFVSLNLFPSVALRSPMIFST